MTTPVRRTFLCLCLVAGCGERPPAGPDPEPTLQLRPGGGDDQYAPAGALLPVPLQVVVERRNGAPAAGLAVEWRAVVNGTIEQAELVTDQTGRARAIFRLGTVPGRATASATVGSLIPILFHHTVEADDDDHLTPNQLTTLMFPTYDGSGEVVHPDVLWVPDRDIPLLLAITPYPGGDNRLENPSLFGSRFGREWRVPPGVVNPLARTGPGGIHLSDPDLVRRQETGEFYLYYREVTDRNVIKLIRSADAVTWTAPLQVVAAPNHDIISPAVVQRGPGEWLMWSVNGGAGGCGAATASLELRRSSDGIVWGHPVSMGIAPPGFSPWHVDVQWIPERAEYWALYNAKTPGSCATGILFMATSPDGRRWTTVPRPVLRQGHLPAFEHIVYRSTFRYLPATDEVVFWFTGARFAEGRWQWSAAADRRTRTSLFQATTAVEQYVIVPPPAPLVDWP